MFKTRYALPGTSPTALSPFGPGEALPPIIRVMEYGVTEFEERTVRSVDELPMPRDGSAIWIEFNGLADLQALCALGEKYDLHPLSLEDVVHAGQRPKLEPYEDHLFMIAQMIYRDDEDDRLVTEQVSFFLFKGLLITIQEDPKCDVFEPVRERVRSGKGMIRKMGPDYLTYALLDAIIDHGFPILECIGEALEDLEDEMLSHPSPNSVSVLHDFRRTLINLRRAVWPERDLINSLLHDESKLITDQTKVYLRDCHDHAVRIMDLTESYRELTAGLLELYLTSIGLRTNEIMRVLTVISAIFIPLTFVAGVYGMNFDNMPELRHPAGYFICLGVMITIAGCQIAFFRRKKWL